MQNINTFITEYFKEINDVNRFHFDFLIRNRFQFPKVDYLKLKKFIDNVTHFLQDIDDRLLDPLGAKLYNDIDSLYKFYNEMKKKTEFSEVVFYREYLETLQEYKSLKEKYETLKIKIDELNTVISKTEEQLGRYREPPKEKEALAEYKRLKRKNVDSIYEYSKLKDEYSQIKKSLKAVEETEKLKFFDKFEQEKKKSFLKMEKIINCKLFYYDRLLWYRAKNSREINKFFENSHIDGDFSTKTFIKYFLKNIDSSKAKNKEWIVYLTEILKVVE